MSTCGKMIAAGKHRILVDAKEPSLVPDLLDSLKEEFPGHALSVHDDAVEFSSAALGGGMFSDRSRILVLWNFDEDGLKELEQVMGYDGQDTIVAVQRKSIPKSRLYTRMKADWEIVTLEPLDDRSCEAYVASALKKRGCQHAPEVPSMVIERVGRDLPALRSEAKKLAMLGRTVDKETAARVVRGHADVRVFDFADAILRRRWGQACSMAATAPEGDLIGLLHVVQSQCLKLYKAATLKDQGMAPEDVASMIEVPPYIAKTKIIPLATQMGRQRILKMLDAVHVADAAARTSRLPKRTLMESVVVKLLRS